MVGVLNAKFLKPLVWCCWPLHNEHENVICAKKSFIEKRL